MPQITHMATKSRSPRRVTGKRYGKAAGGRCLQRSDGPLKTRRRLWRFNSDMAVGTEAGRIPASARRRGTVTRRAVLAWNLHDFFKFDMEFHTTIWRLSGNRFLENALGPDVISQLQARTGLSQQQIVEGLAQVLPRLVNNLTPNGRLPTPQEAQYNAPWGR